MWHEGRRSEGQGALDMRTIITVGALAATIISGPALARSHHSHATAAGGAAARAYGAVSPARGVGAHPYGQSFEGGDYKYCMKDRRFARVHVQQHGAVHGGPSRPRRLLL